MGVDLAWSPKHASGVAEASVEQRRVTVEWTGTLKSLDEIVDRIARLNGPVTIAVDAPTVVPNSTGGRPVDRCLQRRFGARHAAPYSANRTLLGRYNGGGPPRGEEFVALLKERLHAQEGGIPQQRHSGVWVMEVFPAAAIVELFRLERGLKYKKKPKRSWESCRKELRCLLARFKSLDNPSLEFRTPLRVGDEKGARYKEIEDQADAALCAYLAGLAWLEGDQRLELVGSMDQGYIVLPRPTMRG